MPKANSKADDNTTSLSTTDTETTPESPSTIEDESPEAVEVEVATSQATTKTKAKPEYESFKPNRGLSFWRIRNKRGGRLPKELEGSFTKQFLADREIERYLNK